jgi:DNA-binding winged helix-turn-helix (wHTH) protein
MDRMTPAPRHNPLFGGRRQEHAVLSILLDNAGRVVGRREIARNAGLAELSERRCDSLLVQVRRQLGADSIITVRRRGWMLAPHRVQDAMALLADDAPASGECETDRVA